MNKTSYEEYLNKYGELTYRNVGVSMLPMLKQGRDLFTVSKKNSGRCKKYDVVLYRRPPNRYVLHRIVEVREDGYVILGDHCMNKEYGVTDEDIVGVLVSFQHRGKEYPVTDRRYRIYSRLWYWIYPIRMLAFRLKSFIKRDGD